MLVEGGDHGSGLPCEHSLWYPCPMMACNLPSAPCSSGAAVLGAPVANVAARATSTSALMRPSSSDAVASPLCVSSN
eukprot:2435999-Pyramimonas_sp.AAC.1